MIEVMHNVMIASHLESETKEGESEVSEAGPDLDWVAQ